MATPVTSSIPFTLSSTPTLPNDPQVSRALYLSSTITSLVVCITPMLGLMYLVALSWTYKYARKNPRPLNKASGIHIQRYAPAAYVFLVLSSLAEIAIASWLLLQYRFHDNFPNGATRIGARLLLFCACWTVLTAGTYTLLFLHPTWSRHPVSSLGAQAIWVFITWLFWIVGAGIVNTAVPSLLAKGECSNVVYCGQLRSLYGVAVVESLILTAGMGFMIWLAWQSTRDILRPAEIPLH